jgi:tetratricopeptide (TPR) repeat protein
MVGRVWRSLAFSALLLVLPLAGSPLVRASDDAESLRNGIVMSEYSLIRGDLQGLRSARGALARLSDRSTLQPWGQYYLGLTNLRLILLARTQGMDPEREWIDGCIDSAKLSLEQRTSSETFALLGACYGMKSVAQPLGAPLWTPRSGSNFKKALDLDPENPRAWYLQALVEFHTPGLLGGSIEQSETMLLKALSLYENDQAGDSLAPDWGEADAWLLSGRINLEKQDVLTAREALERSLLLAPGYSEAEQLLQQVSASGRER